MSHPAYSPAPGPEIIPLDLGIIGHNLVRRDGQGRWMLEIARELAARGHEITVYAFSLEEELLPLVRFERLRRARGPQLVVDYFLWRRASGLVRAREHDAVSILGPCALPPPPYIFCAAFAQRAWTGAWKEMRRKPGLYQRLYGWVNGRREKIAAASASGLVSMSAGTAGELRLLMPPGCESVVSPGGVDAEEFLPPTAQERRDSRARWGLAAGTFVIALIGEYVTPRKGLAELAEAVALGRGAPELILVRGEGDETRVRPLLEGLGITRRVKFTGVGPAREVMAAADAVAIPSHYEPFSLVALEAAACARPVIISERAGAASYLVDARAAVSVDPSHPHSIRMGIDQIKNDPKGAAEMGSRARALAESMTWENVSGRGADFIERIAAGRRAEGRI